MRGWIKLDDGMPEHPKIAALEAWSAWTFVCSLAYSSRNLTDGFVPSLVGDNMAEHYSNGRWNEVRDELVAAGLWEPVEGGYRIHDYLDYQRSKTDVLGISKVRAEAGRRGGKRSSRAKDKQTPSKTQPEQELEQEKARTARTREGKSRPEPRPAAAAYQPFHNGTQPTRDVELGLAAIHDILTAGE